MTKEELKAMNEQYGDYFTKTFMDLDNGQHMDWKEQVLEDLKAGKKPPEIVHYNDVFDRENPMPDSLADLFVK